MRSPGWVRSNTERSELRISKIAELKILDSSARRHETFNAVDARVNQASVFSICFPHHAIARIDSDVVNILNGAIIRIEE